MKKALFFSMSAPLLIFVNSYCYCQKVGISVTGADPNPSSILDIDVTGMSPKAGLLIPRMSTTERNAIANPAESLQIFNTTTKCLEMFVSGGWYVIACPSACPNPPTTANAGIDQNLCNVTTTTLAGNVPTAGTGTWSVISGTVTVTTPSSATSGVTGLVIGTSATLAWTITNIPCTPSTDYVIISVAALPTTANAGSAINPACGVTTATLAGNNPSVGFGTWSWVSGSVPSITSLGTYNSGVTGLTVPGTTTLRWTISNSPCTASTSDVVITTTSCFSCGTSTVSDGTNTYNTVLIGTQCWMKENLNYGTYVPVALGGQAGVGTQKYCQNLSGVNDNTCPLGGLYEWTEMMNGSTTCNGTGVPPNDRCATPVQGICPSGWHIPSHYEWTTLEKNAGTNPGAFPYNETTNGWLGTDEGGNLKQTGTSNWISPNTGATDSKGFTALPGGNAWLGTFTNVGHNICLWSSTGSLSFAWRRTLYDTSSSMNRTTGDKTTGYSVRCVKD